MIFKNQANGNQEEQALKLLDNKIIVHPLWEPVPYKKEIDWNLDPFKNRTWCYYFHSLSMVNFLVHAYEQTPNLRFLEKAFMIISSWSKNNASINKESSEHAWKDHSTANRVIVLIHFWTLYRDSDIFDPNFEQELFNLLKAHGEFLFDDDNYNFRNNHGVFQDRALIELSILFPTWTESDDWFKKAKSRLMSYTSKFVSETGVHKEHSSAYHILMLKLLRGIDEFLIHYNQEIDQLTKIIYLMEEYLAYIVKPNGKVPMTGDSGPDGITFLKQSDIKNQKLLFVRTNGEKGEKPLNDKVYKEDGVGVFKDNTQTYFMFLSAFHSLAHKHADDLSFLLTLGKTDFFVDSGKYNYEENDPFRQYFRSSLAHNSITVDRKSYKLRSNQSGKSGIKSYELHDDYSYIIGEHHLYPGVKITRTILWLKEIKSFLIHDTIKASSQHTYSQIFNIGKNIKVDPISKKKIILESLIDDSVIELLQINHVTEFKNYTGETKPIAGWQSTNFNKKHPITQLQFSNKGTDLEYKSIINLDINQGVKNYSFKTTVDGTNYTIILKNNKRHSFKLKDRYNS